MSRRKAVVKGGAPIPRIKESSRLMRTHETMVDYINGRHPTSSFLDVFASGFFGLDFLRNYEGDLEDDIIYSDNDDNDHVDSIYTRNAAHRPLEPHPRIRQLTDEEADKHAKELMEEEERRKEKTEKNKRKKMRKKEKKRLEKENAVKDISLEEEQGKSDFLVNQEENTIEINSNDSAESGQTQNVTDASGCEESMGNNKEENLVNKKEDDEQKVNASCQNTEDLDLNNSYTSTCELVPEETSDQRSARGRKKEKNKLKEVQQSKEEKPEVVERPEVHKKEEKQEPSEEKAMNPTAEELAKKSRELAGKGNRLAASGQYEMAVKYFTDAIKYNPKEFKLFGNRSLCYERMQQYENALRDADLALSMEPNWIKGLFRKGKALCGLKRYDKASLIYKEVLRLESSSVEAMKELKRAQTLHLMEMGFSWQQSSEALKTHGTLEEAVEALFSGDSNPAPADAASSAISASADQPVVLKDDDDQGEWTVLPVSRPRMQQVKEFDAFSQTRSKSQSPTPHSRSSVKPQLFPIWVGSLAPAVTYTTLHELFSRVGTVYSIKILLEHQCAFVNYTRKEDCDRAIQCINGMVVEGAPLSVRHPYKFQSGLGASKSATTDPYFRPGPHKKECFFWRTSGCTRQDCTYLHVPEHKSIDKDKFTSRLGNFHA